MIDPIRERAFELAKEYCDDHMSWWGFDECVRSATNRFARAAKVPEYLDEVEERCQTEAMHAMAAGYDYVNAFKRCVDALLGEGGEGG